MGANLYPTEDRDDDLCPRTMRPLSLCSWIAFVWVTVNYYVYYLVLVSSGCSYMAERNIREGQHLQTDMCGVSAHQHADVYR